MSLLFFKAFTQRVPRGKLCGTLCAVLVSLFAATARAHHGRDFILIQDGRIPSALSGVIVSDFEWTRDGDDDEFTLESGFFTGLTPILGAGISGSFVNEGNNWKYEGVTPQFSLTLLPPWGPMNFRIGLWEGYEFAEERAESGLTTHYHNPGSGPDAGTGGGGGHVHSHGGSHSHGGIHRHGESGLYSRLVLEADVTEDTHAVFNLINFVSGSGSGPGFGYGCGLRHEFNHDFAMGLEMLGDFRSQGSSHQILLTTMFGLPKHVSLRFGVGGGLTKASPDFTMHSSILWRF